MEDQENQEVETPEVEEVLDFVLEKKERKLFLTDPGTGTKEEYVLRELNGLERDQYLNFLNSKSKIGKDGKVAGVTGFDGIQSNLVARCLFKKPHNTKVEEKFVQAIPASIQKKLYEVCTEMCGLEEGAADKAKND